MNAIWKPYWKSKKTSGDNSNASATAIALNAAGVNSSDAQWITAYLDADHGFYQYEVSFVSGTYEYDFEIDATHGTIMESDIDSVFD